MRPELWQLITDFQRHVAKADELFRQRLHVQGNILSAWQKGEIPATGELDDDDITYSFKGISCEVMFGPVRINIDFEPDGRCNGFDASRLSQLAWATNADSSFWRQNILNAELVKVCKSGEIVQQSQSSGSQLFFLPHDATRD